MYKTKNNSKSKDKNKNNNSSTNLNKRNTNSNYFNFGLYIKKNMVKDRSYDRIIKNRNQSEDISYMENRNKSTINVNNNKEREKDIDHNNNLIKVSKSIEQNDRYALNKRRKRRRETLYEILNSRKNTPNYIRNANNISNDKENENDNENKKKLENKYIYSSGENNYIKRKTTYGFYGNKLNHIENKENIIQSNDINKLGFKRMFFRKTNDKEDNNLNSI